VATHTVDRRPDPDAPFDTIMKNGCTAHDTIQEVDSTSLKEWDKTSSCVVELHWQSEKSIDLSFVLSICFAIHNGKWGDRYTLQRYNCYFISWAIIVITMRKSAVCRAVFNIGKVQGGVGGLEQELELELEWELERQLARELELELARELELERALELVLGVLARELAREVTQGHAWELAGGLAGELADELAAELVTEPMRELARELVTELALKLPQGVWAQVLVLAYARAWEWAREWWAREGGKTGETAREIAREWAHGLGQIPLMLGSSKNPALAKAASPRQADFVIPLLWGMIHSNIARKA
jgi:hypothetical protein